MQDSLRSTGQQVSSGAEELDSDAQVLLRHLAYECLCGKSQEMGSSLGHPWKLKQVDEHIMGGIRDCQEQRRGRADKSGGFRVPVLVFFTYLVTISDSLNFEPQCHFNTRNLFKGGLVRVKCKSRQKVLCKL